MAKPGSNESLRLRLTVVSTTVVAVVLLITALAVLSVQDRQLTSNLDAALQQRADVIADTFANTVVTTPLNTNDEDRAVQLVALDGEVLAATTNLADAPGLTNPLSDDEQEAIETRTDLPIEDDAFRVLARRVETPSGPAVLFLAENTDDLRDALRNLTIALATTIPAVIAILAVLMWWLVGRTLRPVDEMRAMVDSISATNADTRVEVAARNDEISRLGITMNRMLDRLSEANERQRRFVADAAHELRTPLTRIRTNLDVDLAHPETADPSATLRDVRQETIELEELVEDLLHLAKSDAGHSDHHREAVDLDDIVLREVRDLRAANPGLHVDTTGVSAAHLQANPGHLGRAIRNLLHNASRHADTSILVQLSEGAHVVELSVADDGPGIPAKDRERAFERFARLEDSRVRHDGGTGLGLAITRDIIEDHHGTITYDDDYEGARFVVRIPSSAVSTTSDC